MMKIKILQVIGGLSVGGAEMMVMNFLRFIDKEKFHFDFLVYGDKVGEFEKEAKKEGANIIHISEPSKGYRQFSKNIKWVFSEYGPYDVVHSHTLLNNGFILREASKSGIKHRISHSHSTHNRVNETLLTRMYEKYMKSLISRHATAFMSCGEEAGNYLYGKEKFCSKGIVFNNGIDAKKFQFNSDTRTKIRENLDLKNKLVIGNIGRFHKVKNLNYLIDIFASINVIENNSVLLLVGDGDEKSSIENRVKMHGLTENVIFMGMRSDIPEIMQAMDVFVMPSLFEGLPVVLVEAQAAGLPCVVSNSITQELQITDLIHYVDLIENPDFWAKKVLAVTKENERCLTNDLIEKSGYDIHTEIKKLEKIYLSDVDNN